MNIRKCKRKKLTAEIISGLTIADVVYFEWTGISETMIFYVLTDGIMTRYDAVVDLAHSKNIWGAWDNLLQKTGSIAQFDSFRIRNSSEAYIRKTGELSVDRQRKNLLYKDGENVYEINCSTPEAFNAIAEDLDSGVKKWRF